MTGPKGEQNKAHANRRQTHPAQNADRISLVREPSCDWRDETDRNRPWGHQQAGFDRGSAKDFLKEERKRDKGEALGSERADRRRDGQREDRSCEQFDGQHRVGQQELAPDKESTGDRGSSQLQRDKNREPTKIVDTGDQLPHSAGR